MDTSPRTVGSNRWPQLVLPATSLALMVLHLIGDGWRSLGWISWLLLAVGWVLPNPIVSNTQSWKSMWSSWSSVAGVGAMLLGLGLLLIYNILLRWS